MYERDHESQEQRQHGLDPRQAERIESAGIDHDAPSGQELSAASAGRVDALGADGLLRMQRYAGNAATGASVQRAKVHDVISRPSGSPIPADVRGLVERNYGPVPADARVHSDGEALESAREVGAYAYASGRDIVMPADAPRHVQLEETVHLVQQSRGTVAGTDNGQGLAVSSPTDAYEVEAQQTAAALDSAGSLSSGPAEAVETAAVGEQAGALAPVQRSTAGLESEVEEEEIPQE